MRIKRPLGAVAIAIVLALAGCSAGADETSDQTTDSTETGEPAAPDMPTPDIDGLPDVVAEVNGEEIDRDEFVATYEGQFQQALGAQQGSGEEIDQDQLKTQVADSLVNSRLLVQAADAADIEVTEEDIDDTLSGIAAQYGLGSVDELVASFGEQGLSEDDIRSEAATQFQVDTFISTETDIDEPSDAELHELYDAIVEQMGDSAEGGPDAEIPSFDEARDQLAQQSVQEEKNDAVEGIVAKLRDGADVKINL